MGGHHLILGELVDFITGETLTDTHDERYRQEIARLLVTRKGYLKNEIKPRLELVIKVDDKRGVTKIDFVITIAGKVGMIIKYGPGSLVTRHRPALAAARLVVPYQVPVVVVTNGKDAEILDGSTGKVIKSGLEFIPSRAELIHRVEENHFDPISAKRAEMEARIIYAFEIDGSCRCDDRDHDL